LAALPPRFELKLIIRSFACWRHTAADACASEAGGQCRWLAGGDSPAGELWSGLGRPCVLDEAVQTKAVQDFYVSPFAPGLSARRPVRFPRQTALFSAAGWLSRRTGLTRA
jgi:hypothetical protein